MRNLWFSLVLISLPLMGSAQSFELYAGIYDGAFNGKFTKLLIDYENGECSIVEDYGNQYDKMGIGLAFCPDGVLYGLGGPANNNSILYSFDPQTGEFEYVSNAFWSHFQNNNPYSTRLACIDSVLYSSVHPGIFRKLDLATKEISHLSATPHYITSSDIGVMNNEIYYQIANASGDWGIYQLDRDNPSNSSMVFPYPAQNPIEFRSTGVGGSPLCNTLFVTIPLSNTGAFYNIENQSFSVFCNMPSPYVSQRASIVEQQYQDCELLIDLDAINVSGAGGYDYLHDESFTCLTEDGVPIAAEKVFIATDQTLQQMSIEILSPQPQEFLQVGGSVGGIEVTGEDTPSLSLQNTGSVGSEVFLNMIQLIEYNNSADNPTAGIRQVRVNFSSTSGKQSNDAFAVIEIEELDILPLDLGEDVQICEGESHLIEPNIQQGSFQWSTGQTSSTITVDQEQFYTLTVSDGIHCPGIDSVYVELLPVIHLSLFFDPLVCIGESSPLVVTSNSQEPIDFSVSDQFGNIYEVVEGMVNSHSFNITLTESVTLSLIEVFSEADICIEYDEATADITALPSYNLNLADTICTGDSLYFYNEWLDQPGQFTKNLETQMGCDSTLQLDLVVLPVDSSIHWMYTCDPQGIDTSLVMYQNQHGCDSVALQITEYYTPGSTFLTSFSCYPEDEQLLVDTLLNQWGCDSLVFSGVQYLPPDSTSVMLNTCNPDEQGSYTDTLTNQYGCDSLVFVLINYLPPDTLISVDFTCEESEAEYIEEQYTNQWGCDSLVISAVEYIPPDSTTINLTSCDPEEEGVFVDSLSNRYGCDSVVISVVSFSLADSTFLTAYSCDQAESGWIIDSLQNQQGCDSLVFTQVNYSPPDTIYEFDSDCDPDLEGITVMTLQNSMGCDSVVIRQVDLLPSDSTFLE